MFDYKEAYCEVFEMFRDEYKNQCGKEPDFEVLYQLAHERAEEASRGMPSCEKEIESEVAFYFSDKAFDKFLQEEGLPWR